METDRRVKTHKRQAREQIVKATTTMMEHISSDVTGTSSEVAGSSSKRQRATAPDKEDSNESATLNQLISISKKLELGYIKSLLF